MTDLDLRLRVEQAAAVDGVVAGVVGEWRLLRGTVGSPPLVIDEPDAARCCVADAIGQVCLDWPRGVSSPTQATAVAELARAVRLAFPAE
eukprot:11811852-Alexandrium_andersonii.AAC.1